MLFSKSRRADDGSPMLRNLDGSWRMLKPATENEIYSAIEKVRWYEGRWVKSQEDYCIAYAVAGYCCYISWSFFTIAKGASETWATDGMFGNFVMLNFFSLIVTAGIHTFSILNSNYYLNIPRYGRWADSIDKDILALHLVRSTEFLLLMFEAAWISSGYTVAQAVLFDMYTAYINTWEIAAISGAISGCILGLGESFFALPGIERGGLPHILRVAAYIILGVACTIAGAYLTELFISTGIAPNPSLYGYTTAAVTLPLFCLGKLLFNWVQETIITFSIEIELSTQGKYVKQLYSEELVENRSRRNRNADRGGGNADREDSDSDEVDHLAR